MQGGRAGMHRPQGLEEGGQSLPVYMILFHFNKHTPKLTRPVRDIIQEEETGPSDEAA